MTVTLNNAEQRVLRAVEEFARRGEAPSMRDLCDATGIKSPSQVKLAIDALAAKALVTRERHVSRSVRPAHGIGPRIQAHLAAGKPLEAVPFIEQTALDLTTHNAATGEVALRVGDGSLAAAHISPGDYLIVRPNVEPRDGELVLAARRGGITLARFHRQAEHGRIRLEPLGASAPAVSIRESTWARDWRLAGVVIAVYRPLGAPATEAAETANVEAAA
ncbi:MAG TPA: S24 family peptidase [Ktedonobacterales bacterium]|jgi:repressor LexA|nr:S24 family peptidase [Ktedonobacterales bacterium]